MVLHKIDSLLGLVNKTSSLVTKLCVTSRLVTREKNIYCIEQKASARFLPRLVNRPRKELDSVFKVFRFFRVGCLLEILCSYARGSGFPRGPLQWGPQGL